MTEILIWGQSATLLKGQGSCDLVFSLRGTKGLSKAYVHRDRQGLVPLSNLFYSTLSLPYELCNS
jgi:hypothetical protein